MKSEHTETLVAAPAATETDDSCLSNIWSEYKWIIIAVVVVILLVGGWWLWKRHRRHKAAAPATETSAAEAAVPIQISRQQSGLGLDIIDDRL